jgi:Protein of unknown function (DUF2845)
MKRLLLLALLTTAAGLVQAGDFRCGTKLVSEGDTRGQVVAKCGEPTDVSKSSMWVQPTSWINGRPYTLANGVVEVPVEEWTYNLGPQKLMRRVRFENDRVVAIDTLGYGYVVEGQ